MLSARRGIVLITTLLMMVLVVMMVTVVVYAGTGGLALTGNFYEREAALLAADSGLQYAMTRMQADSNWRGDNPDTAPAPRPDFAVLEKDGNVFGFLSTTNGHRSQFRIKFNYENGDLNPDQLEDSSDPNFVLTMPLVSVNNLLGTSSIPVQRAKPSGYGVSTEAAPYEVPKATACILVEGLAGWGLRDANVSDPNNVESNRAVTRRVVEAYFTIDNSAGLDSAAFAAGTLDADLADGGTFRVSSKDDDINPRMRSLQNVTIDSVGAGGQGVTYDDGPQGEVVVKEVSGSFTVDGSTPTDANVKQENSSSRFQKITWNAIAKASATSTTDAKVPAGTYVWRADKSGQPFLEYFDVEYTSGMSLPSKGSGTRVDTASITSSGSGITVDPGGLSIMVSNNVYVNQSQSGAKGMAILTDPALTTAGARPSIGFVPPEASQKAPIVTASGSVRLEGAVMGTGAITSEGDITFQGPSILESDPETGVSLYAKGDINLMAIPDAAADKKAAFVQEVQSTVQGGGTIDVVNYMSGATTGSNAGGPTGPMTGSGSGPRPPVPAGPPMIPPGLARNVSTFVEKKQVQLQTFVDKFGRLDYADQNLTGVIYTWKNFNANLGDRGVLSVTGTVIAYGGNPEDSLNNRPGTIEGKGMIDITASSVDLTYDSTYLKDLLAAGGPCKVKRTLWATY